MYIYALYVGEKAKQKQSYNIAATRKQRGALSYETVDSLIKYFLEIFFNTMS